MKIRSYHREIVAGEHIHYCIGEILLSRKISKTIRERVLKYT